MDEIGQSMVALNDALGEDKEPNVAPGWYRLAEDPRTERYFDGAKWTDSYRSHRKHAMSGGQIVFCVAVVWILLAIMVQAGHSGY